MFSLVFILTTVSAPPANTDGEVLFSTRVYPLLSRRCFACHGQKKEREGGLDLRTRQAMLRGGESSLKVLVPGKPSASRLWSATNGTDPDLRMPPKKTDWLTRQQVEWIRKWIAAGAPWPDESRRKKLLREFQQKQQRLRLVKTSGGLSADWTNRRYDPAKLWAYRPLRHPKVPQPYGRWRASNPIDAFVNQRLQQANMEPAQRADRRTLIRRVTLILTGLPPSAAEVRLFLGDRQDDRRAFAAVVDRLLASPQFGERWGRHWLDVVRYADSSGLANDYERPNAWRYRDYVIRSLNRDKPYSKFTIEQLAGDELDETEPENLIAVGFLRMGPWEHTGMSVAKVTRQQFLDDVTDAVGQVFLSHPLQCCRCHDHKFDPIPTRDYYSIQAVFATTQFATRFVNHLPGENKNGFAQQRQWLQGRVHRFQRELNRIRQKTAAAARQWYMERWIKPGAIAELRKRGVRQFAPRHIGLNTTDFGLERVCRKTLVRHRWELDQVRPLAYSVYSGATRFQRAYNRAIRMPENRLVGEIQATSILKGGSPFARGQQVQPGVLSCLDQFQSLRSRRVRAKPSGRRLDFARWVADPGNPLTARSIVNRVWQWSFGRGLVRDPNNFGAMGGAPSHPKLLDFLAAELKRNDWSLKAAVRSILNTDAWCRSPTHPRLIEIKRQDPTNLLYAMFQTRRLTAEELRDAMLQASGELNLELGGLPIRPEIDLEVALQPRQIMGTYAPAYQPSRFPFQRHRRSVYVKQIRGLRNPLLEVFNQPSSEKSCSRRESSTITPQVFALWNGRFAHDRALALAQATLLPGPTRSQAIRAVYLAVLGRVPADSELQACLAHWQKMTTYHQQHPPTRQQYPRQIVRQAIEEMNGEPFKFVEHLDYDLFVPDLQPADVQPPVRALADICHVLLNTNEFMYVR